jgi:D-alanyl-lipoteichoic acid acyltransferase DltB (MBOAT superfamily)
MPPLSPAFFAFSAIVIACSWACFRWRCGRVWILLAANFFFLARYAWFYPAVLFLAASLDFLIGLGLQGIAKERRGKRQMLVGLSLLLNVGLLAASKLLPTQMGVIDTWFFPLSLSFYCFQSLTYTIDLFRGTNPGTRSYVTHLTATTFFPVIVAGPINRVSHLIEQLRKPFDLDRIAGSRALLLIASGLMKKMLIADYLGDNVVNRVFDTPALYSGAEALIGVYAYALQIYYDFSGYTDIAMGICLLLGITVPDNFNRPYQATSVQNFWKRWHITFSNWLTNYVFYSLPNAARWPGALYLYPIVVFVIGGIWHGIGWTFVVWGLLHGGALSLWWTFQVLRKKAIGKPRRNVVWRWISIFLTFQFVCFTWIYFRAPDLATAKAVLLRIGSNTWSVDNIQRPMVWVMLAGVAAHCIPAKWFEKTVKLIADAPFFVEGTVLAGVVLLIEWLSGKGAASFVYGGF